MSSICHQIGQYVLPVAAAGLAGSAAGVIGVATLVRREDVPIAGVALAVGAIFLALSEYFRDRRPPNPARGEIRDIMLIATRRFRLEPLPPIPETTIEAIHQAIRNGHGDIARDLILEIPPRSRGWGRFVTALNQHENVPESVVLALIESDTPPIEVLPLIGKIPEDRKLYLIEGILRKKSPEELMSMGISLDLLQKVKSEEVSQSEITQFIRRQDPAIWTTPGEYRIPLEMLNTPLGIAICLCSHIKGYEAVVLEIIKRLSEAELRAPCATELPPLQFATMCGASTVVSALLDRLPDDNWTITYPSNQQIVFFGPLEVLIAMSSKLQHHPFREAFGIARFSSPETYQKNARDLIAQLPLKKLENSTLWHSLIHKQKTIAKALILRGVPCEIAPQGEQAITMNERGVVVFPSKDLLSLLGIKNLTQFLRARSRGLSY